MPATATRRTLPPDLAAKLAAIPGGERMVREMQRRGMASADFVVAVQQCSDALPAMRQMEAEAAQQRQRAQAQAAAEREAVDLYRQLSPQDKADALEMWRTPGQGWPAVVAALKEHRGWSDASLEVLTSTAVDARTPEALAERFEGRIQAQAAAAQTRQAEAEIIEASIARYAPAEGDSASVRAVKEGFLAAQLRDPAFQAQAGEWYRQRAAHLTEQGVTLAPGESPAEFLVRRAAPALLARDGESYDDHAGLVNANRQLRTPKIDADEAVKRLAEVMGEDPATVRRTVAAVGEAHTRDLLRARLAERDDRIRREHPIAPSKEDKKAIDHDARRRSVVAERAAELEAAEAMRRSGFASEAPKPSASVPATETAREARPPTSRVGKPPTRWQIDAEDRRAALSQAFDRMEGAEAPEAEPQGDDRRAVLDRAAEGAEAQS